MTTITRPQDQRSKEATSDDCDESGSIEQRNALIEEQMGLAEQIAGDYRQRGVDRDDLRQVAFLALVKAADRFDPERGTRFPVYASLTINGEIKRYFRDHGWSVRPPRSVQEAYLDVRRANDHLSQELGRQPTVEELSAHTGLEADRVQTGLDAHGSYRARSLDETPPGEDTPVRSLEPSSIELGYEQVDDQMEISCLVRALSERDLTILRLRFWDGLTQSEIAARLGVSQVQVSRLLRAMMTGVRERVRRSVV